MGYARDVKTSSCDLGIVKLLGSIDVLVLAHFRYLSLQKKRSNIDVVMSLDELSHFFSRNRP